VSTSAEKVDSGLVRTSLNGDSAAVRYSSVSSIGTYRQSSYGIVISYAPGAGAAKVSVSLVIELFSLAGFLEFVDALHAAVSVRVKIRIIVVILLFILSKSFQNC
jgi:hypothetical protein